jgi:predicted RNA-binding Zn ribbon-like protein
VARDAIRSALALGEPDALNEVLAHGAVVERLGPDGPECELRVDDERWRLPWLAAHNLLELLRDRPNRIRNCANDDCVLWFYDDSRGGRRQWCSMATCGNRAKARRHYARTRSAT